MNVIVVSDPWIYSCEVSFADIMQMSKPLKIISVRDIVITASTCSSISDVSISPGGYSTLTTADSLKLAHYVTSVLLQI